jgi:hypothetical protein
MPGYRGCRRRSALRGSGEPGAGIRIGAIPAGAVGTFLSCRTGRGCHVVRWKNRFHPPSRSSPRRSLRKDRQTVGELNALRRPRRSSSRRWGFTFQTSRRSARKSIPPFVRPAENSGRSVTRRYEAHISAGLVVQDDNEHLAGGRQTLDLVLVMTRELEVVSLLENNLGSSDTN